MLGATVLPSLPQDGRLSHHRFIQWPATNQRDQVLDDQSTYCDPPLRAWTLKATPSGQRGGAGHGGEIVTLTAVGDTACTTGRYPGLGVRNAADPSVPLTVNRQPQGAFLFGIEWINQANLAATTLILTPPNDTSSIVVARVDTIPANSVVTGTALTTSYLPAPCGTACGG